MTLIPEIILLLDLSEISNDHKLLQILTLIYDSLFRPPSYLYSAMLTSCCGEVLVVRCCCGVTA